MSSSTSSNSDLSEGLSKALDLKEEGELDSAYALASRLADEHSDAASVHGLLGILARMKSDYSAAVTHFSRACELSPTSEKASLGLFHSLWQCDRTDEAFDEMKRFTSITESDEYTRILSEAAISESDEKSSHP